MDQQVEKKINAFWSKKQLTHFRLRWWQSPHIIRHINEKVYGQPLDGFASGINQLAIELARGKKFTKGISVGCGEGHKEMNLIRKGLVTHFDLYELAEARIERGRELAHKYGLEDQVTFNQGNAFEAVTQPGSYDFVHWNNSLHHMMNVEDAVAWSHRILIAGGMFYMDDFIGPSRFQWTDRMLMVANRVRSALPVKYLINPYATQVNEVQGWKGYMKGVLRSIKRKLSAKYPLIGREIKRPSVESMIEMDPSEAADSANILHQVKRFFPNAQITLTGGVIYHLVLNDILANIDERTDRHLLDLLMIIDDLCSDLGENHYATALAIKEK